jgi:hypothetical protein
MDENLCIKNHKLKETIPISGEQCQGELLQLKKMFHANQDFSQFRQPFIPSQNIMSSS